MNHDSENNKKTFVINILPQNSDSWFWIAIAIGLMSISSCTYKIEESGNKVEIEKAKIEHLQEHAKVGSANIKTFRNYYRDLV